MRKLQQIAKLLGLSLLILFGFLINNQQVAAATDDTVTVAIHALLFDEREAPEQDATNDGDHNPFVEGDGLNGIEYSVYDVTTEYWREGPKNKQEMKAVRDKLAAENYDLGQKQPLKKVVTSGDGEADFELPKKRGKHHAVYLFKETKLAAGLTASQNLVVVLPLMKNDTSAKDQAQERLDLYPKNTVLRSESFYVLNKTITNDRHSFSAGESIPYQLQTVVPSDIGSLDSFIIEDQAAAQLQAGDTPHIALDGKTLDSKSYQFERLDGHHFKIMFVANDLVDHVGEEITVDYQMALQADTTPDQAINNTATLYPGNQDPVTATETVTTSGKRFVKVDLKNQQKQLSGAQFVISNQDGQYLVQSNNGWRWVTLNGHLADSYQEAGLYLLTSQDNGQFVITGLATGKYQLHEVVAPKHYQLNKKAVPFTIVAGEYADTKVNPLTIVNLRQTTPTKDPKTPTTKHESNNIIAKIKDKVLPQAGEHQILWLSGLGLLLLAILVAAFYRRATNQQKN